MTCVAGHQPNLYPYAGFFAKVATSDKFVIADNTQYVKKEYHNRNRILQLNGLPAWITVPVKNTGHYKQKINEAEIDYSQNWQKKHEKALIINYRKAQFSDKYLPEFLAILAEKPKMLADLNIKIIKRCLNILNIETPVLIASELDISGDSTGYILNICKKTDSDAYMHGKHAYDYVDFKMLTEAGIKNIVQEYKAVPYKQHAASEFLPNMSILDIIFNCGPNSKKIILSGHKQKTL